jgi:hypothetical protein
MTAEVRQGEVLGSLDQRLMLLENNNSWEKWFGKHPGVVLGIVIGALFSGFWMYHTWQVERIEKNFNSQITDLKAQNKGRIDWLKEQQKQRISSASDKCSFEKGRLNSKLLQCSSVVKKHNKKINKDT